jgi:hypothetical protein
MLIKIEFHGIHGSRMIKSRRMLWTEIVAEMAAQEMRKNIGLKYCREEGIW